MMSTYDKSDEQVARESVRVEPVELKPCPHCGRTGRLEQITQPIEYLVLCPSCESERWFSDPADAITAWNKRAANQEEGNGQGRL